MTINAALRITTLLQVSSGGLALLLAGTETALSGAAIIFFSLVAGLVGRSWPVNEKTRKRFWNILALVALGVFIAEFTTHRQLLPAVVRLVIFLTTYKLFTLQGNRDYFTVYMLSFLQLLAATSISYDYFFAVPYILFVVFSCMALVLLTIKSGKEREQSTRSLLTGLPPAQNSPPVPMKRLPAAVIVAVAVLLLTGAIFPFLPRVRTDVMNASGMEQMQILSGFSTVITLDAISDIKTNPEIVMRVSLDGDPAARVRRPKLRGIVLSMFDGLRWTHTFSGGRRIEGTSDDHYYFGSRGNGPLLIQHIQLHPLNTRSIFSAALPEVAQGPFGMVLVDSMDTMFMSRRHFSRMRYTVESRLPEHQPEALRGIQPPEIEGFMGMYVFLPNNESFTWQDRGRIEQLTRQITDGSSDLFEIAKRLETYLRENFAYSLELSQYRNDRSKMTSFLFDRRAGHCSYFASGMAVMLRSIGIPARIVNGFQLGQYNAMGNFYTVRAADAHSWVEVYFPGRGWVEFDPTPAAGQQSAFATESPDFFASLIDNIDMLWTQYVLAFDAIDQQEFFEMIAGGTRSALSLLNDVSNAVLSVIPGLDETEWLRITLDIVIKLVISAALLFILIAFLIRPLMKLLARGARKPKHVRIDFFERAVALLRKGGYRLSPTSTARELIDSVETANGMGPTLRRIVSAYETARFSEDPVKARKAFTAGHLGVLDLQKELRNR